VPELSPAAQAVLDAWEAKLDPMVTCLTHDPEREALAAALRAAVADQPYDAPQWCRGDDYLMYRHGVDDERDRLLAIAAELNAP